MHLRHVPRRRPRPTNLSQGSCHNHPMASHTRVTPQERQAIITALNNGTPYAQIAADTHRGKSTISRIAQEIGHQAGQSNANRAREARSAYSAERRAEQAARCSEEIDNLLDQLHKPWLAFNFGGKDNTFAGKVMPEPSVEAKRAIIQSVRELMRTVLDVDRHDNRADEGGALVDQWLQALTGGEDG